MYHPFTDAIASMIMELPNKICSNLFLNIPLYWLSNLRREPGPFFTFLLFGFASTLVISNVLRTLGHVTHSVYQALAPYAVIVTAMVLYTGFVLPVRDMQDWLRWLEHLDPISYAYESLVINELRGRRFDCNAFVPAYDEATAEQRTCGVRGGEPGSDFVNGDDYIRRQLGYDPGNIWRWANPVNGLRSRNLFLTLSANRNFGILVAFIIATGIVYLVTVEYVDVDGAPADTLVFLRKGNKPADRTDIESGPASSAAEKKHTALPNDAEKSAEGAAASSNPVRSSQLFRPKSKLARSEAKIFQWKNLCYDITVDKEERRLLDNVFGWVKPGSLTALMVSMPQLCASH